MDFQYDELSQIFEDDYYKELEALEETTEDFQMELAQSTSILSLPVSYNFTTLCESNRGICSGMTCKQCRQVWLQGREKKVDLTMVVYCKKLNLSYEHETVFEWDWEELKTKYDIHPPKN